MTLNNKYTKTDISNVKTLIVILSAILICALISDDISRYARGGLLLCYNVIIGSVFPFMILTDLIQSEFKVTSNNKLAKLFVKAFKINSNAFSAFVCGCLCGFPIGVKAADDLYRVGAIKNDEYERLIGFSNNAGPAFVISGIGVAMRGSLKDGIILYLSMLLSSITVGILFSLRCTPSKSIALIDTQKFDFTRSVKNATASTLNVCGFVTVFSVLCGFLGDVLKNSELRYLIYPFLEISNASKILSSTTDLTRNASLSLTSFAVSFSGISVHAQAKSFITNKDISMKRYYLMKLLSGVLSSVISLMLIGLT